MKKSFFLFYFIFIVFNVIAQNKNYYVSNSGNDFNDGSSTSNAWKTINKVNSFDFEPGDIVHFNGGESFSGMITITKNWSGVAGNPLIIKSYGNGIATINAGYGDGIRVTDAEYVEIRNLKINGDGISNNDGAGIYVTTSQNLKMLDGIVIDNVDVSGFYWMGIGVAATNNTTKGFLNLKITNSTVYNNGISGIETSGSWNDAGVESPFNHIGIYIGYNKVFQNHGINTYTDNWSGTGILMAGVENGLIEYCEAFDNGKDNGCDIGGPVGIWLANSKNCIIQYCESYNNKAGRSKDGGGFDIDGGAQNCILQYNFSHDNEGPGFALFEWGNTIPFTGNIIRYNISQNDARKNNYGALTFWGVDSDHKILNSEVYNNTIYVSNKGLLSGTPSAVKFMGTNMKGLKLRNNIFYITEGVNMLQSSKAFDTSIAHFQNNNYYSTATTVPFQYVSSYKSLADWKKAAIGQEMIGSKSLGFSKDPFLINPGGANTIYPATGGDLTSITAYMLNPYSEMIDAALDLKLHMGLDIGNNDFYKNTLQATTSFDIGANEFVANKFMVMPLRFISFIATYESEKLFVQCEFVSEKKIRNVEIQVSSDGTNYTIVQHLRYHNNIGTFHILEEFRSLNNSPRNCRIKISFDDESFIYSSVSQIQNKTKPNSITYFPNPVTDKITITLNNDKFDFLLLSNFQNQTLLQKPIDVTQKQIVLDCNNLSSGIYLIVLFNKSKSRSQPLLFIKR